MPWVIQTGGQYQLRPAFLGWQYRLRPEGMPGWGMWHFILGTKGWARGRLGHAFALTGGTWTEVKGG
jgi:hypothetical protein